MKVLITGGAGYIGSILTRMLLEMGYEVKILDRFFFGKDSIKEIEDKVEIFEDDVRNFEPSILSGVDAVIDMAALSNDPSGELDQNLTLEINYKGRLRVAKLAKKHGVKKYILASSCSVYGFQDGILNENSKVNPLTTYAKANVLWENETLPLADKKFCVTALRQATCYGFSYRMRFDLAINGMVLGFFKDGKIPIMRDGNQWRPFVHVKDTSEAFIKVLEAEEELVNKQVFNVGSNDQNYQIFPLAELIANSIGLEFNYEWYGSPDNRSYRVDFSKISKVLNFKPKFSPREGAKEVFDKLKEGILNPDDLKNITVKWYKSLMERGVKF
ncbi:MAG: SDR family oxidoreductase [Candidatus Aenigmatarchaeota archaeon]